VPRLKQMEVLGTFDSGHFEYDSTLALVHWEDAARIFRLEGPSGVRLKLRDLHQARAVAADLQTALGAGVYVRDWSQQNRTWFAAVQVEKRMMFIILTLIVAVAAFNLVSTLVMTVTDKRADIAILRTLGASPRSVMGIFVVQGAASGVIGTLSGVAFGLLVAVNIGTLVPALERLLGVSLPATLIFQYPTIEALTAFVEGMLAPDRVESVADVAVAARAHEPHATDLVDALSDDEAEALLRQTLETLHLPS
jgi:lipoprotein-releasing system permease protein